MFVSVLVSSSLSVGDVVTFSTVDQKWVISSANPTSIFGVLKTAPDSANISQVIFKGIAWAKCSDVIPDEGGHLNIQNGGVIIGSDNNLGLISPNVYEGTARDAGDLVMVYL
jgi:hypothetical protein